MIDPQNDIFINANGQVTSNSGTGWKCTVFVPVVQNYMYTFDPHTSEGIASKHCFYSENQEFISAINSGRQTFTTPIGCKFMRFSFRRTSQNIMLVEGSTAPTSYIPFGYKLPMVVRTENLYDYHNDNFGYFDVNGQIQIVTAYPEAWSYSEYILVVPGVKYIALGLGIASSSTYCCIYDKNKNLIGTVQNRMPNTEINVPYDGAYVRLSIRRVNSEYLTAEFIGTIDNPIYIGDTQLMQDEYVDFGEQKIYRMVNGTLTPTDPPVPIPALPTIQGETIIDYNPSTTPAVEPEKMYVKYKPQ